MPSTRKKTTKTGREYYEIRCRISREAPELTRRWYVPDGWSQKVIDRELAKAAAEFERQCKAGEHISRSERKEREKEAEAAAAAIVTLKQYGENVFMPTKKAECAEKTRKYYQDCLNNHLYPVFGERPIAAIGSADLSAFFKAKQASSLSHSTVNGIFVTANQLFKMAFMEEVVDRNPLDRVKRPRQKKDDKCSDPPRFTEDEVKHIKRCLVNEPLKWQAFVTILLDTGMRRGECCGLLWDNIDFARNTIRIDGNLGYTPEKGVFRDKPKTESGDRLIPMTSAVAIVLAQYRKEQIVAITRRKARLEKEHKIIDLKTVVPSEYVFTVRGGSDPMLPDSVNRYFTRFGKRYGIEDFHPHKLRHTAVSIMLENNVPDVTVAAIAGHKDAGVTNKIYGHASVTKMKTGIETLEKVTSV